MISIQKISVPKAAVRLTFFLCILFLSPFQIQAKYSIGIVTNVNEKSDPIALQAMNDFKGLLKNACNCEVGSNENAEVIFKVNVNPSPDLENPTVFSRDRNYPYLHYPEHSYAWSASGHKYSLDASTPHGTACGLYGFLQEKLGFLFVHPRETIAPDLSEWPLNSDFSFEGRPIFDKKGFHLHTQHPLELTGALHRPWLPESQDMIREYIDWLARNGQNYFEFCLLEGAAKELEKWAGGAKDFVSYANSRGIICGVDFSIHMVQQKAFQLVKFFPADFRKHETQIRERLRILASAGFQVFNMEFALAEFVGGMEKLRYKLREIVLDEMKNYPDIKLVGRQHVIKPESEIGGSHSDKSMNRPDDPSMGILVHTVMCYALTDTSAPVYELDDFSHLHELLLKENAVRETWYYPESAYWITFDNSVPMFLPSYLFARFRDIRTVANAGIPGHITFSSGWEWGYWLVDWSIARWCWEYKENDRYTRRIPFEYISTIFNSETDRHKIIELCAILDQKLVKENLLMWLCPSSAGDELPFGMNKAFQPRPPVPVTKVHKKRYHEFRKEFEAAIDSLESVAAWAGFHLEMLKQVPDEIKKSPTAKLRSELQIAFEVTVLRMQHRAEVLKAALAGKKERDQYLNAAAEIRMKAIGLVREQEKYYRYDPDVIVNEHKSFTAYDFGYLYTVHDLHFWKREEEQVRRNRHGPFFMNIYDLGKIAGFRN